MTSLDESMHHRVESISTTEGKIRAACDRCHDLKNRCVRSGGPDSRCDRCERLNIDCVYRTNSRTGRPRIHRPPPDLESDTRASRALRGKTNENYNYSTTKSRKVNSRQIRKNSSDAAGTTLDGDQNDAEAGNASGNSLDGSMSDGMDLVISPEVTRSADLDWSMDFSHQINTELSNNSFNEALFQDACAGTSQGLQDSEAFSLLESYSGMEQIAATTDVGTTTDNLLQLQHQLHRLFLTTDQETIMDQPAVDEVLEATKTFLEILQTTLAAQSPPSESVVPLAPSTDVPYTEGTDEPSRSDQNARRKQASMSYITLLQVLTCYSYILHVLDPVVGALTRQSDEALKGTMEQYTSPYTSKTESASRPSLSLGFFNLASQPGLNADIVLHIVLRMIQKLRASIHMLTSGCKDLEDEVCKSLLPPSATDSTRKLHATPIISSSQPLVAIIGEREKMLVERLSSFTHGP